MLNFFRHDCFWHIDYHSTQTCSIFQDGGEIFGIWWESLRICDIWLCVTVQQKVAQWDQINMLSLLEVELILYNWLTKTTMRRKELKSLHYILWLKIWSSHRNTSYIECIFFERYKVNLFKSILPLLENLFHHSGVY